MEMFQLCRIKRGFKKKYFPLLYLRNLVTKLNINYTHKCDMSFKKIFIRVIYIPIRKFRK